MASGGSGSFTPFDWALFLGISLIWGASFLLIAEALEGPTPGVKGLTPGVITLGRVGSGALTLVVLRLLTGRPEQPIVGRDRRTVVFLSVVWVAVPFTLFPLAQEHINSALTGLLNGSVPIFVAVIGTLVGGIRPRGSLLFGLVLGFVGVVTLSLPSIGEGASQARGVLMVLAATLCYGVALNVAGPLQRRYGAVSLMTPILVLATLWLIPGAVRDWDQNVWSADVVMPVLLLGVLGTGLAYWIMATLIGRVGPIPASFITYLIPVVSLLLGVLVRGDHVAALALVGAALTTLGALLASGRIRPPRFATSAKTTDQVIE